MIEGRSDKTGGPAFPTTKPLNFWGDPSGGMDLRDWFAGLALIGLLSTIPLRPISDQPSHKVLAGWCYQYAGEMIKAREESQ